MGLGSALPLVSKARIVSLTVSTTKPLPTHRRWSGGVMVNWLTPLATKRCWKSVIPVNDLTALLVVRIGVGVTDGTASPDGVASPLRLLGRRERLRFTAPAAAPKTAPLAPARMTAFELPAGMAAKFRDPETCL